MYVSTESIFQVNQDPYVSAAVMFGRGRFQAGVLIEPKPQSARFRDQCRSECRGKLFRLHFFLVIIAEIQAILWEVNEVAFRAFLIFKTIGYRSNRWPRSF
ncbi:hypothetical protein F5146DRAFT_518188 [Armillaria mellea]|nr:hypothetical protein F5146DRAFT_518188 [Armillaria mellea]